MTESISWSAICAWSITVALQMGIAVRDAWRARQNRPVQGLSENFRRIMNGETRNGWRRILMPPGQGVTAYLLGASLTDPAEQPMGRLSVDTDINAALPNGRETYLLLRHSCLRSTNAVLLQVVYDQKQWHPSFSCYVNPSTVAIGFSQDNSNIYTIVVSDMLRRKTRQFRIAAPLATPKLRPQLAYISKSPKFKLHLIFLPIKFEEQYHFIDGSYDLSVSNENVIHPLSWETIQFPAGDRHYYSIIDTGFERLLVFHARTNPDNPASHFCISIDHTKTWHGDTLDRWISSYRETKIGASILEAIQAIEALPPPASWILGNSQICLFRRIDPHPADREIVLHAGIAGVFQRWLAPPFLKRVAAESFFKANSQVKLSEVMEATGVDVSDGIPEENDHAVDVIYLS